MTRRMPVPLVPGERGGMVLDAELPPLTREELDAILALVGGGDPRICPTCPQQGKCTPAPSWARKVN